MRCITLCGHLCTSLTVPTQWSVIGLQWSSIPHCSLPYSAMLLCVASRQLFSVPGCDTAPASRVCASAHPAVRVRRRTGTGWAAWRVPTPWSAAHSRGGESGLCLGSRGPAGSGGSRHGQVPSRRARGGLSIGLTCCSGRTTCLTVSHPRVLLSISKCYFGGVITRPNGLVCLRGTRRNEVARRSGCTDSIHGLSA